MDTAPHPDLTWMLDELVTVRGILAAVVLSSDGLVMQKSAHLEKDAADTFAASVSGLYSLSRGLGKQFGGGPVAQVMVELERRTVLVTTAGMNTRLAVLADEQADLGTVGYEMTALVERIARHLASATRTNRSTPTGGLPSRA
jgi:predicted regulator of Ras-like GTPase activity (Roadblock/LC7/MglB family)